MDLHGCRYERVIVSIYHVIDRMWLFDSFRSISIHTDVFGSMKINADFNKKVIVHSEALEWAASPMPGVARKPLDRVGAEVARATSIVRYAPGSSFSPHVHSGGEEFIVLEGVFQDEHGDFPAGSYIRNPPQSSHTPRSDQGCVIFVKLWQFDPKDRIHVRLNSNFMQAVPHAEQADTEFISLYADQYEEVSIQRWQAGSVLELVAPKGIEILVLDGDLTVGNQHMQKHSWLRSPVGSTISVNVGSQGAKVWLKKNHLYRVDSEIEKVATAARARLEKA